MDIFRGEPMPRSWDPSWWGRHHYNDTVADMVTVIDAMYQHATNAPIASLQLAGYCYGGGVAAGLTAVLDRPVLSAVSAHPTWEDPQGNSELGELETLVDNGSSLFFVMVGLPTHSSIDCTAAVPLPASYHKHSAARSLLTGARACCVVCSLTTIRSSTIRPCDGSTHPSIAT